MAGRGRGRGRGQLTFNIEAVGIGKGENLPPSTLQPTPLFPPMEHKPVPLQTGEEAEYMLALKQELRGAMKNLPFYIRPAAPKKDVERYSDKYQSTEPTDNTIEWDPDWKRLPRELRVRVRKPLKERALPAPKCAKKPRVDKEEIIRKLEVRADRRPERALLWPGLCSRRDVSSRSIQSVRTLPCHIHLLPFYLTWPLNTGQFKRQALSRNVASYHGEHGSIHHHSTFILSLCTHGCCCRWL
uniref:Uncharacterized protein n=1 Tax=Paramormyrops kingsleyae TaxID=1676925 RepID=A0A3B3SSX3_9TELE